MPSYILILSSEAFRLIQHRKAVCVKECHVAEFKQDNLTVDERDINKSKSKYISEYWVGKGL